MSIIASAERAVRLVIQAGGTKARITFDTGLVWWMDPQTKSTLAMPIGQITSLEVVQRHIAESRAKFNGGGR